MSKRKKEDRSKKKIKQDRRHTKSTSSTSWLYKGVYKIGERFRAAITIDGKTISLGKFDTPKEAAQSYDLAVIQARRPISKLNFLNQIPKNYKPKKKKLKSTNTIGYRGVSKSKGTRFQAKIYIDGKMQYLGTFGTTKEAAIAWDLAAIQAKRLKSDLNFPFLYDCRVIESSPKIKKRRIMR